MRPAAVSRRFALIALSLSLAVPAGVQGAVGAQSAGTGSTVASPADPLAGFPASVAWHGQAVDRRGQPLSGRRAIEIRYFAGDRELYAERYREVEMRDGRFSLRLGTGSAVRASHVAFPSLQAAFSRSPKVEMELRIGSTVQSPRLRVLPAGHSPKSLRALAGLSSDNGKPHSKFYGAAGGGTAIEAAVLRPNIARRVENAAPETAERPFEIELEGPWISLPVRELPALKPSKGALGEPAEMNPIRHEDLWDAEGNRFGTRNPEIVDPLAAKSVNPGGARTPAPLHDYEGLTNTQGYYPPDPHGAVGPSHYVQVVNVKFRVFNKDGTPADDEHDTNTLFSALGGGCATNNNGDAIFMYDERADRWLLSQFSVSTTPRKVCVAISQTPDPLGSYYLYSLTTQRYPDYFKFGIWPDPTYNAFFMTTNSGSANQYDVYALDRENMLLGTTARASQYFQSYPNLLMPADFDGTIMPPAGTGGLFYTILDGTDPYFVPSPGVDTMRVYEYKVNWTTPASSTFNQVAAYTPSSGGLAAFNWSVCGFFEQNCLSQPGTSVRIDSASWWPMQRLVYRNFGPHESLYGTWTVDVTGTPDLAAPRWFELRRTGGTGGNWTIYQQGTYSPDGDHRWMGSIAADRDGNIALGYSVVNAATTLYPSIRYTVRAASDPLGTMQAEQTLHVGGGAQTGSAGRWGDYSAMNIDPTDDCTFWFTTEFIETTGSVTWKTRIGSFKMPGCGGMAVSPATQALCSSAGTGSYEITLYDIFTGTTNLSTTNCPPSATCNYTVNPVVNPGTTSTLQVGNLGAVAAGTYDFEAVATDNANPTITRSVPLRLALSTISPIAPTLTSPANNTLNVTLRPTFQWATAPQAESYRIEVSASPGFGVLLIDQSGLIGTSYTPTSDLPSNTVLYWRVTARNVCGQSIATPSSFTTVAVECVTLPSTDVPKAIPDNSSVTSTLAVPAGGVVVDVDVLNLVGTHTYMGDIDFTLTSPDATPVVIIARSCGSADNFNLSLDDEAAPGAWPCPPVGGGTYQPSNPLSAFDGEDSTGTWSLTIADHASQDVGQLQGWSLRICSEVSGAIFLNGFESGTLGEWSDFEP